MKLIHSLWQFRGFVLGSVKRDIHARYLGTLLGATWIVIQPLMMILVYTLIFSKVMHSRLPGVGGDFAYSIHLCAGLLPWLYFSETLLRCQTIFIDNANLMKKSSFPNICLPVITVLITSFNFAVIFSLFLVFLLLIGHFPGWVILAILPVIVLQTLLAQGLGLLCATLNVFFRDVGQLVGAVLQFGFWLTPIIYPISVLPVWTHRWIMLNPLVGVFNFYQTIFVEQRIPPLDGLLSAAIWTSFSLVIGLWVYRRHQREMVDEL